MLLVLKLAEILFGISQFYYEYIFVVAYFLPPIKTNKIQYENRHLYNKF